MKKIRYIQFPGLLCALALLASCGGGGGGDSGSADSGPTTYAVGGTVSGLNGSGLLVLQNNGADDLALTPAPATRPLSCPTGRQHRPSPL